MAPIDQAVASPDGSFKRKEADKDTAVSGLEHKNEVF